MTRSGRSMRRVIRTSHTRFWRDCRKPEPRTPRPTSTARHHADGQGRLRAYVCRWGGSSWGSDSWGGGEQRDSVPSSYRPTAEEPLVVHLFGHLREPDSLLLTEDDYTDFLINLGRTEEMLPRAVRQALVSTSLLFLGYQTESRGFQVVLRSVMDGQGSARRRRYSHVMQIELGDDVNAVESERARRYREQYFGGEEISVYWGSPDDFLGDVAARLTASTPAGASRASTRAAVRAGPCSRGRG